MQLLRNFKARKIRVPGKLIELLRSEIPLIEKSHSLDQINVRWREIFFQSDIHKTSKFCRLKLSDDYDHPTLEIVEEDQNSLAKIDNIFSNSGPILSNIDCFIFVMLFYLIRS